MVLCFYKHIFVIWYMRAASRKVQCKLTLRWQLTIKTKQNVPAAPLSCGNLILTSSLTTAPAPPSSMSVNILKAIVVWCHHFRHSKGWKTASQRAWDKLFLISSTWPAVPCKSKVSQSNERWQSPLLQTNKSRSEMPHQLTECLSNKSKCETNMKEQLGSKQQESCHPPLFSVKLKILAGLQRGLPFTFSELFFENWMILLFSFLVFL